MVRKQEKITVGWREWVALPQLGLPMVKAKLDTGARSSALHAFEVRTFEDGGERRVRFGIHPLRKRPEIALYCTAAVIDRRTVTDSGGHREKRYVIQTTLQLGGREWEIEMTLTDRDTMKFRMLLGRTAMQDRLYVVPGASFLTRS